MDNVKGTRVLKAAIAFSVGMACASVISSRTTQEIKPGIVHDNACPPTAEECEVERTALLNAPNNTVYQKRVVVADWAIKRNQTTHTTTASGPNTADQTEKQN